MVKILGLSSQINSGPTFRWSAHRAEWRPKQHDVLL